MAELWKRDDIIPEWRIWIATRPGVMNDRDSRLFACWCVRQVWHLLTDERSRNAVQVAERYAVGDATIQELLPAWTAATAAARGAARAARGAAWTAARGAAWTAACDAARGAARAARGAARTAACDAARTAACDAAIAAAWDAADAADAARTAAWDAVKDAARAVAWAAAWYAAIAAARDAQAKKLMEYYVVFLYEERT
ncbi:MAG TPA: hypothetical protein VLH56_11450 [Dissulfurispiraceae bacterium]|nr:hypothetical protein [Dissulfurispiraceae bacterium]